MSNGPALVYDWEKIQWLVTKDVPWTAADVVDFVLRVEELAANKMPTASLRPKFRLIKNDG